MKKSLYLLMAACVFAACNKVDPTWDGGNQKPGRDDKAPAGVEAVDLGLSVKWASCNLGASSPWEYGDYFAWGETSPKSDYSWSTYKWRKEASYTKYCTDSSHGYNGFTDNKTVLDPEDDAAVVNWGGKWRMPTEAEWTELRDNCSWNLVTMTDAAGFGIVGYKIASNKNGYMDKWIFLPAAGGRVEGVLYFAGSYGDYWSSSLATYNKAHYVCFSWDLWNFDPDRCCGLPVRPVSE